MIGINIAFAPPVLSTVPVFSSLSPIEQANLLRGEILLETRPHTFFGGAVTARMYLPLERSQTWQQLTDYPRWVQYFPEITHSQVLKPASSHSQEGLRLYQVARKTFLMLTAQVEIYLRVFEQLHQSIQFRLEQGSFADFGADLILEDYGPGTLLTYQVAATPTIPVPNIFIQEAMKADLPNNLRQMRQVLCA
jgi:hypothetical protein